jgi:hypothetical protein
MAHAMIMGKAPDYGTATLRVSAADANSAKTDILEAIRILKQFPSDPDIKLMLNGKEISGTYAIPENAHIMVEDRTAAITENNLGGGGRRRRTNRRNMRKRSTRRRR